MIKKVLEWIDNYNQKNGKYPQTVNITKKAYKRLKRIRHC